MRTRPEKLLTSLLLVGVAATALAARQVSADDPLAIARILAVTYPAQKTMSYIPALSWSGQLRLSAITGEPQWRERALNDMRAFTTGQTPAIAEPARLTSLAGALAFFDAATFAGDSTAGNLAGKIALSLLPDAPGKYVNFATGWTDDMFMAGALLSRVGSETTTHRALHRLLVVYAEKLQRPDGLFIHAENGPHAWGRGNGFALLGLTEALTYLPATWQGRAEVLDIYRRQVAALARHQSDDGSWLEVIDEPTSYRELTVTAMTVAAVARGISRGWIDRAIYEPTLNRGWRAVAARVNADGTVKDVCSSTGAGPTKEYYLNRPVVNGADDRGGAMALLAAISVAEFRRAP
jgi:rhamnogalacturonyl hydrolase YesR